MKTHSIYWTRGRLNHAASRVSGRSGLTRAGLAVLVAGFALGCDPHDSTPAGPETADPLFTHSGKDHPGGGPGGGVGGPGVAEGTVVLAGGFQSPVDADEDPVPQGVKTKENKNSLVIEGTEDGFFAGANFSATHAEGLDACDKTIPAGRTLAEAQDLFDELLRGVRIRALNIHVDKTRLDPPSSSDGNQVGTVAFNDAGNAEFNLGLKGSPVATKTGDATAGGVRTRVFVFSAGTVKVKERDEQPKNMIVLLCPNQGDVVTVTLREQA